MGASDVTLSPAWKARNDIKYVVNHYTMNLDGTTYSLKETETFNNGTSDTSINLDSYAKSYNGFTYDGATDTAAADDKKPVSYKASAIVARDGSLIVSLYYSRNQYTLTVDYNNGNVAGRASDSYTLYYEQKKQITPPVRSLYKFIGWKLSDTSTSSSIIGSGTIQGDYTSVFTMGYADAKITAKWSVLPVFSDVIDNTSFYEGQGVNVNDIKRIIMASDADKLPPDISEGDIFIDSVTYADNTTDFDANTSGWHLDTGTGKIGDVSVTYSTNDVLPDISDITDVKDDIVKVTYDTTLHIVYNDVPRMQLNSVIYVNSGDKHLNSSSIQSFLKSFILMTDAQDSYDNYTITAPISGQVIGLSVTPGQELQANSTLVTISDTSTVTVSATVDERNISYIKTGMSVNLDQWGTSAFGTVETVSLSSTVNNGVASYPITISADNTDGNLQVNSYVNYQIQASQNDNCLMVPIQAVRTVGLEDGSSATVVYVQADSRPDNALELPYQDEEIPSGFYPVQVEIGIQDTYNVEIKSGVNDGDTVFTQMITDQAWG